MDLRYINVAGLVRLGRQPQPPDVHRRPWTRCQALLQLAQHLVWSKAVRGTSGVWLDWISVRFHGRRAI
jgi:hypothetical protein